jgi:spermidine synthase
MSADRKVALLLFGSGFCALVYQVVWMRELRLVFGASTPASAAVLSVFVGGLGLGGLLLGRRADAHPRPLALYSHLELLIAISAAFTPVLLWLVRTAYVAAGGTLALGLVAGTAIRLLLAALVLALPTFLMGGTLPAAARAIESTTEHGRRRLALLYGVNTLGSVAGAFVATFVMIELFGNRRTLWLASLVNVLVAMVARQLARSLPAAEPDRSEPTEAVPSAAPVSFVLSGAAVAGFAFFLMELVWYRMLGPILGGSVFTFGLILTVALLGIGIGGAVYASGPHDRRPTLRSFAVTCLLEAVCIAIPFALGDRIALLALALRRLGALGFFWGYVLGWTEVCALVVLPTAIVAGYQFPMIIALLGQGRREVGRQIGRAYAFNTAGAIVGSLAGGFGLLPLLSAPGTWRAAGALLLLLGLLAMALSLRHDGARAPLLVPALLAIGFVGLVCAQGPTASWRHSGVGAGRTFDPGPTVNGVREWMLYHRRALRWEADGVESSVSLDAFPSGYTFMVNGKADGSARADAPTQIMLGLLGPMLHPNPRRALVIGLGTGATAGWLASVPEMERTDVVELEARIVDVARACKPANHDVLANPKVHITIADAREVLLVGREKYDVIASEPSNPYRAGVASLFTREFYRAASSRLSPDGIFVQWVQAYEVDASTLRTLYATLGSVFPSVETWQVGMGDLCLVASAAPIQYDGPRMRARLGQEPYRSGVLAAWRVTDLEGFLAHFVASPSLAHAVSDQPGTRANTDDQNRVEFGFARTLGQGQSFLTDEIFGAARRRGEDRPSLSGPVDWGRVDEYRAEEPFGPPSSNETQSRMAAAFERQAHGDLAGALAAWRLVGREPSRLAELSLVASALAEAGDEKALAYIEPIGILQPTDAQALLGRLRARQRRGEEAVAALARGFILFRTDPWADSHTMQEALKAAIQLGSEPALAARLFGAIREPFVVEALQQERLAAGAALLARLDLKSTCHDLVASIEPYPLWDEAWLSLRHRCFAATADPRASSALEDLRTFQRAEPAAFGADLPAVPSGT